MTTLEAEVEARRRWGIFGAAANWYHDGSHKVGSVRFDVGPSPVWDKSYEGKTYEEAFSAADADRRADPPVGRDER